MSSILKPVKVFYLSFILNFLANNLNLQGIVTLVTGGASGLGRGTVEYLHRVGAKVVILDIPQSSGSKVAKSLGENAIFTPADVFFLLYYF